MAANSITTPNGLVSAEISDSVCWITFERPDSLNALNRDLVADMDAIMMALGKGGEARACVMRGRGDHFMAGGDVKYFKQRIDAQPDREALRQEFVDILDTLHPVILKMRELPLPMLASVRGAVAGVGVSLMLANDMVLASDTSVFTLAYCHLGVSPDGGSTYFLPRAVGLKRAYEAVYLGDRFDAATAERWGMVNRVVTDGELDAETAALAGRLAAGPTLAHVRAKALLNGSLDNSLAAQLDKETVGFTNCTTSDDFREGVTAFVEKRRPEFKGR